MVDLEIWLWAYDKLDPFQYFGIYQVPFSFGKSYISQNSRSFQAFLKNYIDDTTHNDTKSTIYEHSFETQHIICFDQANMLASVPYHNPQIIWEALKIENHPNNFNREDNYIIRWSWRPIIHHLSQ